MLCATRFSLGSPSVSYTADLEDAVAAHDVRLHAYADDTQLYLKCHTQEATTAAHTLEACITDVTAWMNMNRLKLNADKTDLLWAGSKYGAALLGSSGPSLQLGAETIKASDHVPLLRVTISSDLSLDKHVSTTVYVQRASIGSVRSADYVDHSTQTPQRLLYSLSLCLVSTAVTPCWLERQGPGFNGCSTRLAEWSVEPGSSITHCPNCFTPSYTTSCPV